MEEAGLLPAHPPTAFSWRSPSPRPSSVSLTRQCSQGALSTGLHVSLWGLEERGPGGRSLRDGERKRPGYSSVVIGMPRKIEQNLGTTRKLPHPAPVFCPLYFLSTTKQLRGRVHQTSTSSEFTALMRTLSSNDRPQLNPLYVDGETDQSGAISCSVDQSGG